MPPTTTFGSWLKQRRRMLGRSQAELAQCVPCAEITIRKLESGTIRPGKEIAERLAACLELTAAEQEQFVLVGRGLATPMFPSSPAPPRHNLLEPATAIMGRERELAALRERLSHPSVRLLTITGTGGVGKTRLLQEVALQIKDNFEDGVYFVELARVTEAALVMPTIMRVLGLREDSSTPPLEMLKAFLVSRHLLLLLDNFEHVLPAAPEIGTLVQALPRLKVVVTSRERLNVAAEQEFPLEPLEVPLDFDEDASSYSSVQLFVQRARSANPDFTLNRANRAAVAELCTRLDGLPLAIELAAGRSKLLGPRALLARLSDRFALLSGGMRDLPTRHQSLRATLDWSYDLLTGTEQKVLASVGVFRGGATLEAAEAVCPGKGMTPGSLIDIIASLVDKSLVRQVETANGEPRLVLLETVRVYALEQLRAWGSLEETHHRHADYFLALAEQGEVGLRRPAQREWLAILKAETDNFRAVLTWCLTSPERATLGLRIAGALGAFWEYAGLHLEGYQWVDRLLTIGGTPEPDVQIKAMTAVGLLMAWQADRAQGRRMLEGSLALAEATGNRKGVAHARLWLPAVIEGASITEDRLYSEETLELFESLDDPWGLALARWRVAILIGWDTTLAADALSRARHLLRESEQLLRTLGDYWTLVYTEVGFGVVESAEHHLSAAHARFQQALHYAREGGSPWLIDVSLANLAQLAEQMEDLELQRLHRKEMYEQSRHLIAERSAWGMLGYGNTERNLFHFDQAIALFREALVYSHRYGMWKTIIHSFYELFDTIVYVAGFPDSVPPGSIELVARAMFGTTRLSATYERELYIYAAMLLGAIAPMLNEEQVGYRWPRNEWFSAVLHLESLVPYETLRMALTGGYWMSTDQAVAYALNERL